jgi:hypothetical protein
MPIAASARMALPQALLIEDTAPEQHEAQEVTRMKRQRNAGKTVSNTIYPRIPLRYIQATQQFEPQHFILTGPRVSDSLDTLLEMRG